MATWHCYASVETPSAAFRVKSRRHVYLRNHDLLCFDAGAALCSPTAYLSYELEVDLDIPKRQAEADLGGPKNRSLMSA